VNGTPFEAGPLKGVLPAGLGTSVSVETTVDVELPFINGGYGDMPAHTRANIQNFQFQNSMKPVINIFLASEYAAYGDHTGETIDALSRINAAVNPEAVQSLLPKFFAAQDQVIPFKNGSGLRFLTEMLIVPLPINNEDLYYYYQGLSADGKYYISVILPVSLPNMLADKGDPNTAVFPPQAIPFDFGSFDNQAYYEQVRAQLNSMQPDAYFPKLNDLDALIASFETQP
jgi:hypothetical protein